MDIIWVRAFHIDNDAEVVNAVDHEGRLEEYITYYVNALRDNRKTSTYEPIADSTQVLSLVSEMAYSTLNGHGAESFEKAFDEINERFLIKEVEAQRKVAQMKTIIKSGCLIHAFINDGNKSLYLIAKLQWSDYLEMNSMERSKGIAFDDKKLGRSCLIDFEQADDLLKAAEIQVSLDSANTKYFVSEFLEVRPLFDEAKSTKRMSKSVTDLIERFFKDRYPRERLELKNGFLCAMRSTDRINYKDITSSVFEGYFRREGCLIPEDLSVKFMRAIDSLPESKGFSENFDLVPKAIDQRIRTTPYSLFDGVRLVVDDNVSGEELNQIVSDREANGKQYLKIYTNNDATLDTFKK